MPSFPTLDMVEVEPSCRLSAAQFNGDDYVKVEKRELEKERIEERVNQPLKL